MIGKVKDCFSNIRLEWKGKGLQLAALTLFALIYLVVSYVKLWSGKPHDFYFLMTVGIVLAVIVLAYVIYYCLFVKKITFEKCYLIVGIVFGIFFMFLFPPYSTPDELTHMGSAYYVSNAIMGYENPVEDEDPLKIRACELGAWGTGELNQYVSREGYNTTLGNLFKIVDESENVLVDSNLWHLKPFYAYLIPAIGITIGRVLSWGVVPTAMLGSMFNMLFFVFSSYYAMKKIPFGKMILASYCLLPMTLHMASSYSYDNPILASTVVVIALGIRWCFSEHKITTSEVVAYVVYSILLFSTKGGVYAMFCLLPFLYGFSKEQVKHIWKNYKRQIIVGGAIVAFSWFLLMFPEVKRIMLNEQKEVVSETGEVQYENYIAWADAEGYTLGSLLGAPRSTIKLLLNTVVERSDYYLMTLYGQSLGWFQIGLPHMIIFMYGAIGILSTLSLDGNRFLAGEDKLIVVFLSLVCCAMVIVALLLDHTPITSAYVEGVQGRYLLPAYLACLFCIGGDNFRFKKNMDREILLANVLLGAMMVLYIMRYF